MFTKEEQQQLTELTNSNKDFAYFIDKYNKEYKLLSSQLFHELRNPLTLIKSTAQLIETYHPEIHDVKYWDQLVEDIDGLEILLTELSLYNNSDNIKKQKQDFLLLLKSVYSTFKPYAEQKGIDFSFVISEDIIPYYSNYLLDQVKFQQVFTNLIRNAFDATKKGDYIYIECKVLQPTYLIISVHNNGAMIPSEELSTIFDPFVTYKSGGTGLGLSISSNIIKAHGGHIEAESSIDETCFHVYLPIE